ncbi:MAG: trypsin-like serine protease, partial [Planctomycetaceae bacterium]|nr:trypsin-like serine protease [Planctomycetaceae bacterium]
MAPSGEIIVTWTSWGQDNDSPYETNIYAKNFPSNEAVAALHNQMSLIQRIDTMNTAAAYHYEKLLMTADSPDNHRTPNNEYTGVVYIYTLNSDGNMYVGSGSLLTSGMHILTAAHVVFDVAGSPLPPENILIQFETENGFELYGVSQNYVHPTYTGNFPVEVDLAVLTLERLAPEKAERYDIYRGSNELTSVTTLVGYGSSGTGWTGNIIPPGTRRVGWNRFEAYGSILDPTFNPNTLVFDFDSGSPQHDALGYYFGIHNLGLGSAYESGIAGGDSGGPSFLNGKIAGVHSYGGPGFPNSPVDAVPGNNGSFGEFSVDVRVSAYTDWIDSILIIGSGAGEYLVNETETGNQIWSDVAISASGEVIFTWTSFNQDHAGDGPGGSSVGLAGVYARRFDMQGNPVPGELIYPDGAVRFGAEFLVNDYIVGDQWHSSVSMANNGDFVIVWESYQDKHQVDVKLPDTGFGTGGTTTATVTDFGVYAKRYTNLETLLRSQDNRGSAQYGLPDNTRFVPGYGYVGIHGEIGSEFRVNKTLLVGDQTGATVTLNGNGDAIVVFQSNEGLAGSETKVYYRAIPLQADRSAPIVTETVLVVNALTYDIDEIRMAPDGKPITDDGRLMPVRNGSIIAGFPTEMIVTFSEEMLAAFLYDPTSVINLGNWQLLRNGVAMSGAVAEVYFGLDKAREMGLTQTSSGKWEAVIRFDSDITESGNQPLISGSYTLVLRDTVTDLAGNRLDGNYSGTPGVNFTRNFQVVVPSLTTDPGGGGDDGHDHFEGPSTVDRDVFLNKELGNDKPAIASADDGSYVVVAVHYGIPGTINEPIGVPWEYDPETGLPQIGNIVMQRYDKNGNKVGVQLIVNDFMAGHQTDPDVAMNSSGDIAIV